MSDSGDPLQSTGKLVGAAARGYEILSSWEETAPLDSEQLALIDVISKHCQDRSLPPHLTSSPLPDPPPIPTPEDPTRQDTHQSTGEVLELDGVVLHTTQQFYKWYAKLEALRISETEEEYKECAKHLKQQLTTCKDAKQLIQETLNALDEILRLYKDAVGRSKALRETGERLVEEQNQLSEFSAAVRSRLVYFEQLESIAAEFHSIASSMDSKELPLKQTIFQRFLDLLKRIDDCISYMSSNPQFAEAQTYESRFRQLHSRAIAGIHHRVNEILRLAVQELEPEINSKDLSEGEETNLFYIKFVALIEEQMKTALPEIAERSTRPEYRKLFEDCQYSFCRARVQLLLEVVKKRILSFQQEAALDDLLREGFAYLLQVCRFEHKLFFEFFPEKETPKGLVDLMESLGTVLYDVIRPKLISVSSVDALCNHVSILKNEIHDGQIENLGDSVDALRSIVTRTLADAQERLIYRAQAFIEEKLVHFDPQQEDLKYPGILEDSSKEQDFSEQEQDSWNSQRSVFPPIRSTLEYLEKLHTCLDVKIFSGIAHEAVLACSVSITKAVPSISRLSSEMDGQLFAIRHLLLLREQLIPFRIDFSMTEKDLDFTHMRDHMKRVLSGEVSVFQLPTNNVVQLVTWTAPRITDNQVDSKKQLEKQLKDSCESMIMMATKSIVEPILAFLTKVSAIRDGNPPQSQSGNEGIKPLFEHAFASIERLGEIVESVNNNLESALPDLVSKIRIYLPQQNTFSTLFKPIRSNIIDAHLQLIAILNSEYKGKDLDAVQLKTKEELNVIFDAM